MKLLSLQGDLCTPCLGESRQTAAQEKIRRQVGPKYVQCLFENFRETRATAPTVQALKRYVNEPRGGVFLFGPSGTGKTHLSTAMMRCFIEQGRECQYLSVPEFFMRLKRNYDQSQHPSDEEFLTRYSPPILILDDLGMGPVTDWVCQIIHLLLDKRDRYLKPTIVISNLAPERIAVLFGDPIASRIAGMCQILKLEGEDRRLKGPRARIGHIADK